MVFEKLYQNLRKRLEELWNCSDEELLEIIDEIIIQQGKECYLPLSQRDELRKRLFNSIRKMDVLESLLEDKEITEIMINGWQNIFIEKNGKVQPYNKSFSSEEKLDDVIQQIAARCNRVINTLVPILDARLADGSRVNAVIPPIALDGPILTIRRFPKEPVTMEQLIKWESLTKECAEFLENLVKAKYTILIGGGTGAGKTTFLNALSAYIPEDERVITIEDNAELQIQGIPNLVRLECRHANIEEKQEITMSDLLKTALRMRPERAVLGEARAEEAAQLLQIVNIGHDGSLSTIHANSCKDMISRLETMVLMGVNLPLAAIRRQIASGFDIFIHLGRMRDKTRKVLEVAEIDGMENEEIKMNTLFKRTEKGLVKTGELHDTEKQMRNKVRTAT